MKKVLLTILLILGLGCGCAYSADTKQEAIKFLSTASYKAQRSDYNGAVADLDKALKLIPKESNDMKAYVYYTKGFIELENLKDEAKAFKDFEQAARIDSRISLNLLEQYGNSIKKQDFKTAEKYLSVIIDTPNIPAINKAEAYKMRAQLREMFLQNREGASMDYGMYYQTMQSR